MRHASSSLVLAAVGLVAASGCSQSGEIGDPAPPVDAAPAVVIPVSPTGVPNGKAPIRTVETRNPFGIPADNLLADGDFELSTSPGGGGQYGWRAIFTEDGGMVTETGGICRTGLRCGVLDEGTILYGTAAAAPGGAAHELTLYTKPLEPEVACSDVMSAYLISCSGMGSVLTVPSDEAPGPDGWCRHQLSYPKSNKAQCVYIEGAASALIDSGTLLPVGTPTNALKSGFVTDPALMNRIERAQAWIRDRTPIHTKPRAVQMADGQTGP